MSELYEYKNALEIHDNKCKLHNIPLEVEMDQVDMNEIAYYPYCPLCSMIETIELHANEIHKQMKWLDEDEVTVEISRHVRIIEMYKDTVLKQWKYKQR